MNNGTFMIPILADRYSATGLSIQSFDNSVAKVIFHTWSNYYNGTVYRTLEVAPYSGQTYGFTFRNFRLE